MNKRFFITLLLFSQTIESGKNCLGYTGRRFRQQAIEHVDCNCNCERQYHIRYDDRHGYGCIRCGHRLIPTNPLETSTEQTKPVISQSIKKSQRSVTYKSKQKTRNKAAKKRQQKYRH